MIARSFPLASLCLLVACAAGDASLTEALEGAVPPGTLRVDVYPPATVEGEPVLPQSHFLDPSAFVGAQLELYPTMERSGFVLAEIARGWNGVASVPTAWVPIPAAMSLALAPGGSPRVGGGVAVADETGAWNLSAPADPSRTYLDVVPLDGALPSARVPLTLEDELLDVAIPLGLPVWGQVRDRSGMPIAGATLRVRLLWSSREAASGENDPANDNLPEGNPVRTDAGGWFLARVQEPGRYQLRLEGGALPGGTVILPDLAEQVDVTEEAGGSADLDVGELGRVIVNGSVQAPGGDALRGAVAEFRSVELAGSPGSLVVRAEADAAGNIFAALPPGRWEGVVTAPYERPASPHLLAPFVAQAGSDTPLGAIVLDPPRVLSGIVTAADGTPAGGALVTARQMDLERWVWSATTDGAGFYRLEVPAGTYELTASPRAPSEGALTTINVDAGADGDVAMVEGTSLEGSVRLSGASVPWALLEIRDATTGGLVGRVSTDAEGKFEVRVHVEPPAE